MIGGAARSTLLGSEQLSAQSFAAVDVEEENFLTEKNAQSSFASNRVSFKKFELHVFVVYYFMKYIYFIFFF